MNLVSEVALIPPINVSLGFVLTDNDEIIVRGCWVDGLLLRTTAGEATSAHRNNGTILALGSEAPVEETLSNHIC